MRMAGRSTWLVAFHIAWIPALGIAWLVLAGQSGSPVPDNWPAIARAMDIVGTSLLASLLLFALPLVPLPAAWLAARRRRAAAYALLLALDCAGTVALCLHALAQEPPVPASAAVSRT